MILQPLPREAILSPTWWKFSPPVPVRERPLIERQAREPGLPESELVLFWEALDTIPNDDVGYDVWLAYCHAAHWATGGSAEGLDRFEEWSARSTKHVPGFAEAKVWNYADERRVGGITAATVFKAASAQGWINPATHSEPDDEGFELEGVAAMLDAQNVPMDGRMAWDIATQTLHSGPESGPVARFPGTAGAQVATSPPEGYEPPAYFREKSGVVKPTVENAVRALSDPWELGFEIAHDDFRDEMLVQPAGAVQQWRPITDADLVEFRIRLEQRKFKAAPKELARDAAVLVSSRNRFDSAQMWLETVRVCWDGVRRVDTFLTHAFGTVDTPYTRAVSRYIWTALAGRILVPGVQADMATILEGDQGLRKTSALAAMVPDRMFFVEIDLSKDDDTMARLLRGALVGEISELRGLQTKDQESIKAWVSRRYEKWVPKFKEFSTTFPRRCVLFGTTNRTDIFTDETGNRRWLPVHVTLALVEWIEEHREQLWAEGAAMFAGLVAGVGAGVAWQEAERLAKAEHDAFRKTDEWEAAFAAWLDGHDGLDDGLQGGGQVARGASPFTLADVLAGALGMPLKDMDTKAQMRAGAVLRSLGFSKTDARVAGRIRKVWTRVAPVAPVAPE